MRKSDKIMIAVFAVLCLLLIVGVIVGIVLSNKYNQKDPETETDTTVNEQTGTEQLNTDIPEIPQESNPGNHEQGSVPVCEGDANVDILDANKDNEKDDNPHIVGEPSVIPGVKEATDETQN